MTLKSHTGFPGRPFAGDKRNKHGTGARRREPNENKENRTSRLGMKREQKSLFSLPGDGQTTAHTTGGPLHTLT